MTAPPPTVLRCQSCWIELELLDDDGKGVADHPYWIRLPDGQAREGRLDGGGRARLEGIPCGTCQVRFPHLTAPAVRLQDPTGETGHFLELSLLGEDDAGVAGEPYRVTLPDGSVRSGTLDRKGHARLDGLSAGTCQVSFPALDGRAYTRQT